MTILWNVFETDKFHFWNTTDESERESKSGTHEGPCYRSDKLYCAFKSHGEAGKRKCIVAFF